MMKTQQEWMDYFSARNAGPARVDVPAAVVSVSARDIWEIQCDAKTSANLRHGLDCHKMEHRKHPDGGGYLHKEEDDSPYMVDGQMYCGRCHYAIDEPDAIVHTMQNIASATQAELDGADKVIALLKLEAEGAAKMIEYLQAENLRIRKIAAHVPGKLWLEAEYAAGYAKQIRANVL